jgi:putative ABC transport system substrate-binding protein
LSFAFLRRAALVALALAAGAPAAAAEATAILSSDSGHYRAALEGFTEAWGSTVPVIVVGAPIPPEARVFAVFGSKAATREWPRDAVVVACLASSVEAAADDAVTHVSLLPDPEVIVARIRALAPSLKVLRVFWSSETSRVDVEALSKAAASRGIQVLSEKVDSPARLPHYLRALKGKADAFWLMPDPALVNADNFAVLREYASAEKLPFFAPTEGLAERGATATIAATFRAMGRAAALSLRARMDGRSEPEIVRVRQVTVTVNATAARAAGLGPAFATADKVLP